MYGRMAYLTVRGTIVIAGGGCETVWCAERGQPGYTLTPLPVRNTASTHGVSYMEGCVHVNTLLCERHTVYIWRISQGRATCTRSCVWGQKCCVRCCGESAVPISGTDLALYGTHCIHTLYTNAVSHREIVQWRAPVVGCVCE